MTAPFRCPQHPRRGFVAGQMDTGGAHRHHEPTRRVGIGEVAGSRQPLRLETVLGSCVAVCLYDPVAKVGGMNHILVPSSHSDCSGTARCGVQAMELLINALMRIGADRRRLAAKAFGAGNVLPVFQTPTIGDLNAQFVRDFLATERIPLLAQRLGGWQAVRVFFHSHTGRAFVHTLDGSRLPKIVREEIAYYHTNLAERFPGEDPILF
jgi:chemotaxis protein CheD